MNPRRSPRLRSINYLQVLCPALAIFIASLALPPSLAEPDLTASGNVPAILERENTKSLRTPAEFKQKITETESDLELRSAPGSSDDSQKKRKYARGVATFVVEAPRQRVWSVLTDYSSYPDIFHRLRTCRVFKREGGLVWIETDLKPHLFVRRARNITLNDLGRHPQILDWWLLDGNFRDVRGRWVLKPLPGERCHVTYVLEVDAGPVIPRFLVAFVLRFVQKEVVAELTDWIDRQSRATASVPAAGGATGRLKRSAAAVGASIPATIP